MKNNAAEFHPIIKKVNDRLNNYLESSYTPSSIVLSQKPAALLAEEMHIKEWIEKGGLSDKNVETFLDVYLEHSQHMHSPRYIGHQVSSHHLASGIADFIHGAINNPMAIYEMGPSAAVVERVMINWMLDKAGWLPSGDLYDFSYQEQKGDGVFTHGGSMANLTALLGARAAIAPEAWKEGTPKDLVVLAPEVSHYSISRAISILGLGQNNIISIPVDDEERMQPNALKNEIENQLSAGKRIMAVVANACATTTGLYDPLNEIGEICSTFNVWFHIDGAHGASALVSQKYRKYMKGVEYADSMIWDTHKMLRTTTLSAAVLFRNAQHMIDAFQQKGSYLFHEKENVGFDVMPYTIECTKAPLATKLFWVLAAEGEKGMEDYIDHQFDLTKQIRDYIKSQEDFECPYETEANILCFRYIGNDSTNAFQLKIRNAIVTQGKFYITSAEFKGIRYLRFTVINERTKLKDIEVLVHDVRQIAQSLQKDLDLVKN